MANKNTYRRNQQTVGILLLLLVVFTLRVSAQQLPQYSNYMVNSFAMNPAIAGSNTFFEGMSTNRYQWVGLTDAPRTYILTAHGPNKNLKVGLGGILYTDIVGPTRRTGLSFSYAYHLKVSSNVNVSLGLFAGLVQFVVDGSKVTLKDAGDQVIISGVQSALSPDFGAGIYAYPTDKKWYIGASIPQTLQSKINFEETGAPKLSLLNRHFYVTGGYKFDLNSKIVVEPSANLRYVSPVPLSFDLGIRAIYNDKFWIGTLYRNRDAVSAIVGYVLKQNISFTYSYDFTTSNLKNYSDGTHELSIGLKFYKAKTRSKSANLDECATN